MKKCIYCKIEILDGRAMEVCDECGYKVWGSKMFGAIKSNMDDAQSKGDLVSTNLGGTENGSEKY